MESEEKGWGGGKREGLEKGRELGEGWEKG